MKCLIIILLTLETILADLNLKFTKHTVYELDDYFTAFNKDRVAFHTHITDLSSIRLYLNDLTITFKSTKQRINLKDHLKSVTKQDYEELKSFVDRITGLQKEMKKNNVKFNIFVSRN